nr:MAG TPA: hypothetical protein [Caudoviricetes sp.]
MIFYCFLFGNFPPLIIFILFYLRNYQVTPA